MDADVIAVADDAAPLLRDHIVLHELAHLLLGHDQLDHERRGAAHCGQRLRQEAEAERYAETMAKLVITPRPRSNANSTAVEDHPTWSASPPRQQQRSGWLTNRVRRSALATAAARHILYRQLHPLWLALTAATPHITEPLLNPELDTQLPIRRTWSALRRRVVQIYDSLWHLREHLNPHVYDAARHRAHRFGLDEHSADIEGHAAAIAAAIRTGQPPTSDKSSRPLAAHGSGDVDADAARLAAIAHSIKRSPLVSATIASQRPIPTQSPELSHAP
ncbi:DUF6545 domain-containing protein [Phytohabitans aurantiacus]|nr:DUF6545 domain-containing protein [Phytohabitans aurantiacus]